MLSAIHNLKIVGFKEQHTCIKYCFKHRHIAVETETKPG